MDRRSILAAAALGGLGVIIAGPATAAPATAAPATTPTTGLGPRPDADRAASLVAAATADTTVEPVYGAGLYDVDPDQANVSQDPAVVITGDVASLPDDWEF